MKTTILIPTVNGGDYDETRGCSVFEGKMNKAALLRFAEIHKGENVRAFLGADFRDGSSFIWFTNDYCGPDSGFKDESCLGKVPDYDEALELGFVSNLKYRIEHREVEPPPS
jgi:hypothetical protein